MKTFKNQISKQESLSNFTSVISGYGHRVVTYRSAKTGKEWSKTIQSGSNDLYTNVFDKEYPTQKAFNDLKRLIKN